MPDNADRDARSIIQKLATEIVPGDRIAFPQRHPWLVSEVTQKGGYVFVTVTTPTKRRGFSFPVDATVPVRPVQHNDGQDAPVSDAGTIEP